MGKDSTKTTKYVGLDVHAETISVAVADAGRDGEVRSVGRIRNRPDAIKKMFKKLGRPTQLNVCYEAGPCGYALYWQLAGLGISCVVIAPTLVPVKAGDRVKTDRRDALKLARCFRAGELTPVWVPTPEHEALRELVRTRQAAKGDQRRARQRLNQFLLRQGQRYPHGTCRWGAKHMHWLRGVRFESFALQSTMGDLLAEVDHASERLQRLEKAIDQAVSEAPESMQQVIAALQALRGIAKTTAVGVVAELGHISRFDHPSQLMSYAGLVSSEWSSGSKRVQGSITKAGNTHLRKLMVESSWSYRHRPALRAELKRRQDGLDDEVKAIGWKAQHRLHLRYRRLVGHGKRSPVAVTAVARELLGFVWAIGVHVERQSMSSQAA